MFEGSTDVYGKVGEAMIPVVQGVIGGGTLTFSAVGLPPGLSINTNTGEITGTPVAALLHSANDLACLVSCLGADGDVGDWDLA